MPLGFLITSWPLTRSSRQGILAVSLICKVVPLGRALAQSFILTVGPVCEFLGLVNPHALWFMEPRFGLLLILTSCKNGALQWSYQFFSSGARTSPLTTGLWLGPYLLTRPLSCWLHMCLSLLKHGFLTPASPSYWLYHQLVWTVLTFPTNLRFWADFPFAFQLPGKFRSRCWPLPDCPVLPCLSLFLSFFLFVGGGGFVLRYLNRQNSAPRLHF